jgi:hypothetical protein
MEIIAVVTSTESVTRILENLGLPSIPPAFHSARPPPQTALPFAAGGFGAAPPAVHGFDPTRRRTTTSAADQGSRLRTPTAHFARRKRARVSRRRRGPCFPRRKGRIEGGREGGQAT